MKRPAKVCILYGFCEGPKVGYKLEHALIRAGYSITRQAQKADIIFAHSTGCLTVPTGREFARVFLVGLPIAERNRFIRAFLQNIWLGFKSQAYSHSIQEWTRISFWNLLYLWDLPHDLHTMRGMASNSWHTLHNVTLVRNRYDAICTTHLQYIPLQQQPAAIELSGYHGDCWFNPQPYVQLIDAVSNP